MTTLAEIQCTAKLGPEYHQAGFRLYEENDHTLVLEHIPCGFKDRFYAPSACIEAIKNDCDDHMTKCEVLNEN